MAEAGTVPLSRAPAGSQGTIQSLAGGRGFRTHLVNMGLKIGSQVRVIRSSEKEAGPVLVAAGDTRIAIGRGMASKVLVALDGALET